MTSAGEVELAPRRFLAERVPEPVLEVGQTALGGELAVVAVHPVPREAARADELAAARAVGMDRRAARWSRRSAQGTGRTGSGHGPRCRHAGAAAGGLRESHPAVADLGRQLPIGQGHGGTWDVVVSDAHAGAELVAPVNASDGIHEMVVPATSPSHRTDAAQAAGNGSNRARCAFERTDAVQAAGNGLNRDANASEQRMCNTSGRRSALPGGVAGGIPETADGHRAWPRRPTPGVECTAGSSKSPAAR